MDKNPAGAADCVHATAGGISILMPPTSFDAPRVMQKALGRRARTLMERFRVRGLRRLRRVSIPERSAGLLFGPVLFSLGY